MYPNNQESDRIKEYFLLNRICADAVDEIRWALNWPGKRTGELRKFSFFAREGWHSFRIEFNLPKEYNSKIIGVSISVGPDRNRNIGLDETKAIAEIALLGKIPAGSNDIFNAPIVYDTEMGYTDSRCYFNKDIDGIVEEILRVYDYLSFPSLGKA